MLLILLLSAYAAEVPTKIAVFLATPDVVIVESCRDIGTVGATSMGIETKTMVSLCQEVNQQTGAKLFGVSIQSQYAGKPGPFRGKPSIDADEVPGMIKALDYILAFDPSTQPNGEWTVTFTTKDGTEISGYDFQGKRQIKLKIGSNGAFFEADSAKAFRDLLAQTQASIPTGK